MIKEILIKKTTACLEINRCIKEREKYKFNRIIKKSSN